MSNITPTLHKRRSPLAGGLVKTISNNANHILAGTLHFVMSNPAPTAAFFVVAVQQAAIGILTLIGGRA